MTLRLLAPAGPVDAGRPSILRARLPEGLARTAATEVDWDDGHHELAPRGGAMRQPIRTTHRYERPGVYRVRVVVSELGSTGAGTRYAVVRGPGQLAAAGWVHDGALGRVPFGVLVAPDGAGSMVRCELPGGELRSDIVDWFNVEGPDAMHLGGLAVLGQEPSALRFRADIRNAHDVRSRHFALTVYGEGSTPGRDSPRWRVGGTIRPGGAILTGVR